MKASARIAATFAKPQEEARDSKTKRGSSQRMPHRGQAPERHDDDVADAASQLIHQTPRKDKSDCVGELETANDVPILCFCPADGVLQSGGKQAKDLAIQIINRSGEEQHRADGPSHSAAGSAQVLCPRAQSRYAFRASP